MKEYKATVYHKNAPDESKYDIKEVLDMVAFVLRNKNNLDDDATAKYLELINDFDDLSPGLLPRLIKRVANHLKCGDSWDDIGGFAINEKKTLLAFANAYEKIGNVAFLGGTFSMFGTGEIV